jgi:hypothetical protein
MSVGNDRSSADSPIPKDAFIALEGIYLDAYNAIVRPDRVIPVSRYLLEHWARDLGSIGFWLVAELRQQCAVNAYRREKEGQSVANRNWCRVKQSFLANQIAASRETVNIALNSLPVSRFILEQKQGRRFSHRAGRSVPLSYRYTVALDDPLTPAHQSALHALLATQTQELPPTLRELATLETGDLYQLLERHALSPPPNRWLPAVGDIVRDLHSPAIGRQEEIAPLCAALHEGITRPDLKVLVPWYFRDAWLPRLGHTRALMVLALRARCFYNVEKGIDRNELAVNWSHLGRQLGKDARQIRRLRDHPDMPRFYEVLEEAAGRKPARLKVGMRQIPLLPEDEAPYHQLVTQAAPFTADPETGQLDMSAALESAAEKPGHFPTFGKPEPLPEFGSSESLPPFANFQDSGSRPEAGHFPTHGSEKPGHFSTLGTEKAGHFPTFGKAELGHSPTLKTAKPGHFPTQTIIALLIEELIALIGSSSIAPDSAETAAAASLNQYPLSQIPKDQAVEAEVPSQWLAALEGADSDFKQATILADMIHTLGLAPAEQEIDPHRLEDLVKQHGALSLAAAIGVMATAGLPASPTQAGPVLSEVEGGIEGGAERGAEEGPQTHTAALLDRLGVEGPKRRELEANGVSYAQALGSVLYAAQQPGLTRNKVGYVIGRLLAGEPIPGELAALAALPLETVALFRRAVRYGGPYREAIPAELQRPFHEWQRHFPLQARRPEESQRRGHNWDPGPVRKADGLEDLLGRVEVVPQDAWIAVCDALAGQVPAGDLAALRRCRVTGDDTLHPRLSLWPPDGDRAAAEVLAAHRDRISATLAGLGIHHRVEVQETLDVTAFFDSEP